MEKDQINHVREREKGKQYDKEKKIYFFPLQMPRGNVKEIALLEITEKFKTKLSSVTSLA